MPEPFPGYANIKDNLIFNGAKVDLFFASG
jgi:hypothetical protein